MQYTVYDNCQDCLASIVRKSDHSGSDNVSKLSLPITYTQI